MADDKQPIAPERAPDGALRAGHSDGIPATGRHEVASGGPAGGPGLNNWEAATVFHPDLIDRGGVFHAAIQMTRMPMLVTDPRLPDNPIVFANGAFLDLTGYVHEDILGRNCRFLQGPMTSRATVGQIRQAVTERRPIAAEILNYRKDGTAFWNNLFIGPIFAPDGDLLYFFSSQFDATRRHDAEDRVRQAEKMEAIAQLAAGLAHDFNNALQVVLGNLGRAAARLPNQTEVLKPLERARQAAGHVATLTRQLLTFARRARLEPRPVAVNTLLSEAGPKLSRSLGEGIALRFDLDPCLPPCVVDPTQMEAALLNLLANAGDAMPAGGQATVRTGTVVLDGAAAMAGGEDLKPGRYVVLGVEDEGPGMPPEVLARSIEPFFSTKAGKGAGLGLATVHGFVRQSGGRLEISSAPGRGTTVRMLFPAATEPAASTSWTADGPRGGEVDGTKTVLAVDDDEGVLDLAVHHLRALGCRVLSARSGEEAMEMLRHVPDRVDLLFTDLSMPGGMSGLMLAERARALHPGLRVLLATGYSDDLVERGSPTLGANVLGKPYSQTDLANHVRAVLNRRGHGPDQEAGRTDR
jgi:PAS domain S-box-containing protein